MCNARVRCDAAKEIIYKVFLYFTNESEIFVTEHGYFDKVRQRVSEATGINHKSVYQIVKAKGKPSPPAIKPQKVWVKKKTNVDTAKVQNTKISEVYQDQSKAGVIQNTDASPIKDDPINIIKADKRTANIKNTAKTNDESKNVKITETITGIKRNNSESKIFKISETLIIKRHRDSSNPESEKVQLDNKIQPNLLQNLKIKHSDSPTNSKICKTYNPQAESKTTQLQISNKLIHNQKSYNITVQNNNPSLFKSNSNLPTNMANIVSKDMEPGPSNVTEIKVKKENIKENNINFNEPALAPIKYIKPDPDLLESGVVPIEMEPALKNEFSSDSDDSDMFN